MDAVKKLVLKFKDLGPTCNREQKHTAHKGDCNTGVVTTYSKIYQAPALCPGMEPRARGVLDDDEDIVENCRDEKCRVPCLYAVAY